MSDVQELVAVCIPLIAFVLGIFSVRAWRRDRRVAQLVGGVLAIVYGPTAIFNLRAMGNACGDFLFADVGWGPGSALVDVTGKGCLFLATVAWGIDAARAMNGVATAPDLKRAGVTIDESPRPKYSKGP
jgi:hypothetical protein